MFKVNLNFNGYNRKKHKGDVPLKKNKKIICLIALASLLLLSMLILSSCYSPSYKGIKSTEINSAGELIITYTNGETENLGVVVGEDGKDGKDGKDGTNGKDGEDGEDGEDGKDSESGDIVISGNASSEALAVSKAARSTVSIVSYYYSNYQEDFVASGSGVVYKYNPEMDGYFIITNYHVVYEAEEGISEEIYVCLYGNEYAEGKIPAEYVGGSMNYDIAVLFVENCDIIKKSAIACVDVADSNKVSVGDTSIVVGNARGEGISASKGIVSVDSQSLEMTGADDETTIKFRVMRTDASINVGNSGGGVFNDKGELIGIVNAKTVVSGVEGFGYAIPSTLAKNVADNIIDNCFNKVNTSVKRAMLGITISISDSVSYYDSSTGKISIVETIYVVEATSNNLFGSDIKANDIIKSIQLDGLDELTVTRQFHVIDYMLQARVGDTGTLTVLRENASGALEEVKLNFTVTQNSITIYQ